MKVLVLFVCDNNVLTTQVTGGESQLSLHFFYLFLVNLFIPLVYSKFINTERKMMDVRGYPESNQCF